MTGQGGDWPVADGVLDLGDLPVERGGVIADARLAWQSHGTLNEARDNVIVTRQNSATCGTGPSRPSRASGVTGRVARKASRPTWSS